MVTLANAIREFLKKFFQISAVRTGVRAYMDATPLVMWFHDYVMWFYGCVMWFHHYVIWFHHYAMRFLWSLCDPVSS